MIVKIQLRRGLSSVWSSVNPILSSGEFGYETDSKKLKIGDGISLYNDLDYTLNPELIESLVLQAESARDESELSAINALASENSAITSASEALASKDEIVSKIDFTGAVTGDLLERNAVGVYVPKSLQALNKSLTPYLESPLLPYLNPDRLLSDWGNTTDTASKGQGQSYTLVDGYKSLLMTAFNGTMEFSFAVGSSDSSNFFNFAIMVDADNYYFFRFDRTKLQLSQKINGVVTLIQTTTITLNGSSRNYMQKITLAWTFDPVNTDRFNFGGRTVNVNFTGIATSAILKKDTVLRLGFLTTTGNINYLITNQ
jgi:hypothetical protein